MGMTIREEAIDWLEEAKVDLKRAERSLNDEDYSLSCYMSQQAIEKSLKALLISKKRIRPPHTYDLTVLYEGVSDILSLSEEIEEKLPEVSQYYVTSRYPNAGITRPSKSFNRRQAERAIGVARYIVEKVEGLIHSDEH